MFAGGVAETGVIALGLDIGVEKRSGECAPDDAIDDWESAVGKEIPLDLTLILFFEAFDVSGEILIDPEPPMRRVLPRRPRLEKKFRDACRSLEEVPRSLKELSSDGRGWCFAVDAVVPVPVWDG